MIFCLYSTKNFSTLTCANRNQCCSLLMPCKQAVQALAISDASSFADFGLGISPAGSDENRVQLCPFLSPVLTPSVTFTEFSLLCAHLLSPAVCNPVQVGHRPSVPVTHQCHQKMAFYSQMVISDCPRLKFYDLHQFIAIPNSDSSPSWTFCQLGLNISANLHWHQYLPFSAIFKFSDSSILLIYLSIAAATNQHYQDNFFHPQHVGAAPAEGAICLAQGSPQDRTGHRATC